MGTVSCAELKHTGHALGKRRSASPPNAPPRGRYPCRIRGRADRFGAPGGEEQAVSRRQYDPSEIEPRWVAAWEAEGLYATPEDAERPRFYALDMFPYPSGDL